MKDHDKFFRNETNLASFFHLYARKVFQSLSDEHDLYFDFNLQDSFNLTYHCNIYLSRFAFPIPSRAILTYIAKNQRYRPKEKKLH